MKQILVEFDNSRGIGEQLAEVRNEFDSGRYKNLLFHVYSGVLDEQLLMSLCKDLKSLFPSSVLAGTISAGEILEGRLMNKGVLISAMLFEQTQIRMTCFDSVRGAEPEVAKQIKEIIPEEMLDSFKCWIDGNGSAIFLGSHDASRREIRTYVAHHIADELLGIDSLLP